MAVTPNPVYAQAPKSKYNDSAWRIDSISGLSSATLIHTVGTNGGILEAISLAIPETTEGGVFYIFVNHAGNSASNDRPFDMIVVPATTISTTSGQPTITKSYRNTYLSAGTTIYAAWYMNGARGAKVASLADAGGLAIINTATFTYRANRLYLLFGGIVGASVVGSFSSVTTNGAADTWVKVNAVSDSGSRTRSEVWRYMRSTDLTSDNAVVNITGNNSNIGLYIVEFADVNTGGTKGSSAVVQTAVATTTGATSLQALLSAFADPITNATEAHAVHLANEALTNDTNMTVQQTLSSATGPFGSRVFDKDSAETTVDVSWATSTNGVLQAFEIDYNFRPVIHVFCPDL